jgi:hypothetical protein
MGFWVTNRKRQENCCIAKLGNQISLKIHFLYSHLDFTPNNLGAVSDEQSKRFQHTVSIMEQYYQGRWNQAMIEDYCWFFQRDDETTEKGKNYLCVLNFKPTLNIFCDSLFYFFLSVVLIFVNHNMRI